MPLVHGRMFPEIYKAGIRSYNLNILIITGSKGERLYSFIKDLCTLQQYLKDIQGSPIKLTIYYGNQTITNGLSSYDLLLYKIPISRDGEINNIIEDAIRNNIDIIALEDDDFYVEINQDKNYDCSIVDFSKALKLTEAFVRGHDIPWAFKAPVWNMPWLTFYIMCDDFGIKSSNLYQQYVVAKVSDQELSENFRSLLGNTGPYICYARDKLLHYKIQIKAAKRQGWEKQGFVFEIGYFLNQYYHIIWGALEQIARILCKALALDISNRIKINLANPKFIGKIIYKDKELGELFTAPDFTKWIKLLKMCRDHITHGSPAILSPIVKKPEKEFDDEEITQEALNRPEYESFKRLFPPEQLKDHLAMLKENIKATKYERIMENAFIIPNEEGQIICLPLNDINWHFENYENVLFNTIDKIRRYLN